MVMINMLKMRPILRLFLFCSCLLSLSNATIGDDQRPNIVFIMSDELAYYELEHMGNPYIHTPRIDKMAKEGMRFTQALAVSPVCASLRCGLMTGKHMGHASVRGNGPACSLRSDEVTIAKVLKDRGYVTGGFGKWGIGGRGSDGVPEKHGFDDFFGYYDQVHAHSYFPPYMIRQSEEVELPGNAGGRKGKTYTHYEIMREGMEFIRDHKDGPFFCYFPITPPHGNFDIPATDPAWEQYKDDEWIQDSSISQDIKNYAAMVTMIDNNVGEILDLLKELELENNTIVFFTGDNGGQDRFKSKKHPRGFFGPNVNPKTGVEYRGGKGNLYEGGLRIPFIVRWPGKIEPSVSDLLFYQADVFPTLAELAEAEVPEEVDGISILPSLLGEEKVGRSQEQHDHLYWEHRKQVAVRIGDFKGVRNGGGPWQIYDLSNDPSESSDISSSQSDLAMKMTKIAKDSHEPHRPGEYSDRTLHERDRAAKFGHSKN